MKPKARARRPETPAYTVGVVADTHIPDRVSALHPRIIPLLREAGAAHILHAGDISAAWVLDELRQVAPVTAVRGNRDLLAGPLELVERLELGGVPVALMHGHGGWLPYLWDKWQYLLFGYRLERYKNRLYRAAGPARVAVFGHTHYPVKLWYQGVLLFNPGSASFGTRQNRLPSIGLLRIYPGGKVKGEFLRLEGYRIERRRWKPL